MPGVEHPKGPHAGLVFATPEEALAHGESVMVIRHDDHEAHLGGPETNAFLKRAGELAANGEVLTMEEYIRQRDEGLLS
jgi:hypothetical protein